jgi:hypothetical protein
VHADPFAPPEVEEPPAPLPRAPRDEAGLGRLAGIMLIGWGVVGTLQAVRAGWGLPIGYTLEQSGIAGLFIGIPLGLGLLLRKSWAVFPSLLVIGLPATFTLFLALVTTTELRRRPLSADDALLLVVRYAWGLGGLRALWAIGRHGRAPEVDLSAPRRRSALLARGALLVAAALSLAAWVRA